MKLRRTASALIALATAATSVVALIGTASADLGAPTSTAARTVTRHPSPLPMLVKIRTGKHAAYDRVVFDLRGKAPGYDVRYVKAVYQDGSGARVRMPGKAYLQVRLSDAVAHDDNGNSTLTSPRRATFRYPTLRGYVFTGDFEGITSIALGLSKKAGFRVFTLSNPTRIVVDVAH